ncbi:flagellar protein FlgN [Brevibacillus dissolubilis]|uniref:flagellar protein FlgN n=1 Tax=Brevibacillus dissolubilis TaxID=1844116 RepID=UPI00111739E3|nr:flagellar protein FlgN [Brevibacillus dissolubilis]
MSRLDELYEVLENLLKLHQALYTFATQKKEILIKGDVTALTAISQKEQKFIKAISAAEAKRIELIDQLFAERGLPVQNATLQDFIKSWTGAEEKQRLTHYRDELMRIVSQLRDANELNQQLLAQSLSFINYSLDFLTDTPEDDFIYRKPTGYGAGTYTNRSMINKKY